MRVKPLLWLSLLVMVLAFSACSGAQEPSTGDDPALRVGILSIDDSLPIVMAAEDGDYAEAGLEVELFPFKSSSDQSKALESGELDVVMNDMVVQGLMKKAGTHTKVVSFAFGATAQEGRFVVVAAPDSGIVEPTDLQGQTIAISTNTMMEYLMDQYADYYSLPRETLHYVNMPNLMLRLETVLEGKDVQAAILPDPLASFAIAQGGLPVIDDTTLDENFSQSVILVTDDMLEASPDTIQRFLDVTFAKMEDINAHPDRYREAALAQANVPEIIQDTYPVPTYTPGAIPDEASVQRVVDWLLDKGLIDQGPAYEELVDDRFTHA